jgi:hypothetical protein
MTTTFAQFASEQTARNTIHLNIVKYCLMLCDALRQNYIDYSIKTHTSALARLEGNTETAVAYHKACIEDLKNGRCDYDFTIESGRKYHKIMMSAAGARSIHAFIDKKTGEVYKPASIKGPAKNVRFNLLVINEREWLFQHADWAGGYLYQR